MSVKGQSETVRSLSMRRCTARCAVPALVLLLVVTSWAAGAEPGAYVGWRNCAACHETIAAEWQLSSHARAFAGLKKSAQETLPACIRCHVTGYEQPGGFIDVELTSDLAGVQCEQCHGSGKNHAAAPGKGTIVASPPRGNLQTLSHSGAGPQLRLSEEGQKCPLSNRICRQGRMGARTEGHPSTLRFWNSR